MEIAGLKVAWEQLRNAVAVIYSFVVMATIIPGFAQVSNLVVVPYFVFVPGYFVALLVQREGTLLERLFYTITWSVVVFASVYSIQTITPGSQLLPLTLIIPVLTLILVAYDHFHRPPRGV